MANVITGLRILVSAVLVFCPVFSQIFYVLYLIAGLSDMIDGIIARKTNSVSEFGSRLLNDPPNLEGRICSISCNLNTTFFKIWISLIPQHHVHGFIIA